MMVPSFRHHFFNSVFHGPHSYVKSAVILSALQRRPAAVAARFPASPPAINPSWRCKFCNACEDCWCEPAKGASDSAKILREQAGLRQYQWRTENTSHSVCPDQGRCCIRRRQQLWTESLRLKHSGHCAVLRFPWRWRVIPSELIICRLHRHPQGNCRSVLRECIGLPIT